MAPRPKQSLRQGLDRDVYQIVKKLEDERAQNPPKNGRKRARLAVDDVYEIIKKSNSSLSRQKRKPLEDAIERVLEFHRQEADDSDSEADIEVEENKSNKPEDRFLLNRQMVKHWGNPSNSTPTVQGADGKSVKKRRLSLESEANGVEAVSEGGRTPRTNGASSEVQGKSTSATKKVQKPSKYGPELVAPGDIVLGGLDHELDLLDDEIFSWLQQPEDYQRWKDPPVGFLITGPPGTGKQSLVRALAATTSTPIVPLGRYLDESPRSPEKAAKIIADSFDEAKRCAPCIVLVEHLQELVGKSGSGQNDYDHEVIRGLKTGMRLLRDWYKDGNKPVVVVATTSKPELIDASLRKPDSFLCTINVKVPDVKAREDIFRALTHDVELPPNFDYKALAVRTHGFVGEDIRTVISIASRRAKRRLMTMERHRARRVLHETEEAPAPVLDDQPSWGRNNSHRQVWYDFISHPAYTTPPMIHLTEEDFTAAAAEHTPYMRRLGFSDVPSTSWAEVGGLQSVRDAIQISIIRRIKEPQLFAKLGRQRPAGVLLFGPPGCGKTLVARAVANDAQASFILIKGPELLNKYVGESERAIRELFMRAKSCAPCILFFDEMDSLVPKRENTTTEAGARVVNALLAELDGGDDRGQVYVIGTSNRPDMIDPAILRPGRLDKLLFIDLPTEDERVDILRAIYRSSKIDNGVPDEEDATMGGSDDDDHIEAIARDPRCKGFSGADLYGLYKNALDDCILRWTSGDPVITKENWEVALSKTRPSVNNPETYRRLAAKLHHQS